MYVYVFIMTCVFSMHTCTHIQSVTNKTPKNHKMDTIYLHHRRTVKAPTSGTNPEVSGLYFHHRIRFFWRRCRWWKSYQEMSYSFFHFFHTGNDLFIQGYELLSNTTTWVTHTSSGQGFWAPYELPLFLKQIRFMAICQKKSKPWWTH